jgi:3-hydroxy-3-methylglutaryl CoA synthase
LFAQIVDFEELEREIDIDEAKLLQGLVRESRSLGNIPEDEPHRVFRF